MNDLPIYLFHQGTNYRCYDYLGAHFGELDGQKGVFFRTWAPKAIAVSVVGDFNGWDKNALPMKKISLGGVWEAFCASAKEFDNYKYAITSNQRFCLKADPYAFFSEIPDKTASKVYNLEGYAWRDGDYALKRATKNHFASPMNVYEVNLGSWKRHEDGSYYTYKELAKSLVPYVIEMGYTHVEFMPISEYPFDGSWGYQVTGYFSVSSRFGQPADFMKLVDAFHQRGIGVIIDWVPAHFPKDEHGLFEFDGGSLYEDFRETRKEHKGWGTRVFDYGRNEVQSFLVSSASFFFDYYHIDGIRVDAVASMLYLDYDRKQGEWLPNERGTNINLEAVAFLKKLNSAVLEAYPYALMIAEESTAYPMVTMPPSVGGLGFNFKWNMGWMNDALAYMKTDPLFRHFEHGKLTFSMMYAFSENFVLPISHDEVVHGKCSLINKMPGEYEDKFAGVKAFMGYMMAHPGKKLLFMGQEFGQFKEWNYQEGLEFFLLDYPRHAMLKEFFRALNKFYSKNDALYSIEKSWDGFEWLVADDANANFIAFVRKGLSGEKIVVVINFSGKKHAGYKLGVDAGSYDVVFNSDDAVYGGMGAVKKRVYVAKRGDYNAKKAFISLDIPKFSFVYLEKRDELKTVKKIANEKVKPIKRVPAVKPLNKS